MECLMCGFKKGTVYFLLPVLMSFILFCAFPEEESQMKKEKLKCLSCTLEINEHFPAEEPVNLRFYLKNQCDYTHYVLTWYTPLEGLLGNIFRIVLDDGEQIPYRGIMARRGQPAAKDYVSIKPGETLSAEVDLASSYDLSKAGHYHLQFNGQLHDVTENKHLIPRKEDAHQWQKIRCNAVDFHIIKKPCKKSPGI